MALDQWLKGMEAWEKRVRPVSIMWRWCHSEKLLYSGVWGGVVRWDILWKARKLSSASYSPSLLEYNVLMLWLNCFYVMALNLMNMFFTCDF